MSLTKMHYRLFSLVSIFALVAVLTDTALAYPGDIFTNAAPANGPTIIQNAEIPIGLYSVSTRTGAAQYIIPIIVPPGRQKMQPSLALTYSSQNPIRGGVAAGWNLNIPMVRVDTSSGRLGGVHYMSTLAGGQRLVRIDEPGASDNVEAYRAEHDVSYTRYEKVPARSPNESFWRSFSPDGTTYFFGQTPASRDRPSDYGSEARWFLTQIQDRLGNSVTFEYETVVGNALNGRVQNVPVDIALTHIIYTKNDNAGIPAHARIQFEYVDNLEVCPDSNVPIGSQFSYRTGIRLYEDARRLRRITSQVRESATGEWQVRRQIELTYDQTALRCDQPHAPLRLLTQIQEKAWNIDGEETVLPPITFEYSRLAHEFSEEKRIAALTEQRPRVTVGQGKRRLNETTAGGWPTVEGMFLDLDGDARLDWLSAKETDRDFFCSFTWGDSTSYLPVLPWENTGTPETGFGIRNNSAEPFFLESCSLAYQFSRRTNRVHSSDPTTCGGAGSNYTSYRFMDLDGDGDQDLVTALDYKIGRYAANNDPALQDEERFGTPPVCPTQPPCRNPDGKPVPCKTDFIHGVLPTLPAASLALFSTDSDNRANEPFELLPGIFVDPRFLFPLIPEQTEGRCPGNLCTPGICASPLAASGTEDDFSDPCRCGNCFFTQCQASEWTPPEKGRLDSDSACSGSWEGDSFPDGFVGLEDSPPQQGGKPWCGQQPEMACLSGRGLSYYVWRVYWNGDSPRMVPDEQPELCTMTLSSGIEISAPCLDEAAPADVVLGSDSPDPLISSSEDIFNVTDAPDIILAPIPLESDRPTSSLGAGALAASSSWHGFIDIDGDGFLDAVWQEPMSSGSADVTGTEWPEQVPTGRFLVFRGDGRGDFLPDENGQPYEWRTPLLGDQLRARVNLRRSQEKYPLKSFNQRLLNTELHRFTETVVTLQDINGDRLPDYIESRQLTGQPEQLRVFYNTGNGFEREMGPGGGTLLSEELTTLSRDETVVLTVENNMQMRNGWSMSVRRLIDIDQDGLPDVMAIKPPVIGQRDPWVYPDEAGQLYDLEGVPDAVVDILIPEIEESDQPPVTAHINVGDRLINVGADASLNQWRDGLARIELSSDDNWVVKTDVLDLDGDGLLDLYNNNFHAGGDCQPSLGAEQGNPLFDNFGGRYNLSLCGLADTVQSDADAHQGMRLLTRVDNGQGGAIHFTYAPSTDKATVVDKPDTEKRNPSVLWIVRAVEVDPGFGPSGTTTYSYKHPVLNRNTRNQYGFRGFEEVAIVSPANQSGARQTVIERYDYDLDYTGRLTERLILDQLGNLLRIEQTKWQQMSLFQGAVTTFHRSEDITWLCDATNQNREAACRRTDTLRREIYYWTPIYGKPAIDPFEQPEAAGDVGLAPPDDGSPESADSQDVDNQLENREAPSDVGLAPPADSSGIPLPRDPTPHPLCTRDGESGTQPTDTAAVAVMVAKCGERLTDRRGGPAVGDRGIQLKYNLVYGNDRFHLLSTETDKIVVDESGNNNSWGVTRQVGQQWTVYDIGKLGLPLETHIRFDENTVATTRRTFDASTGNLLTIQKPTQVVNGSDLATRFEYDEIYQLYITEATNELGHTVHTTTDLATGLPLLVQGPQQPGIGLPEQQVVYDGFGRVIEQYRSIDAPGGGFDTKLHARTSYFDFETPVRVQEEQLIDYDSNQSIILDRTFDGLGRLLSEMVQTEQGPAVTRYAYDAAGNAVLLAVPNPRAGATEAAEYRYEYDALARIVRWIPPIGAPVEFSYDGLTAHRTEQTNNSSRPKPITLIYDVFGRLIQVTEVGPGGVDAVTLYGYDANGNMNRIEDADGIVTEIDHDMGSRRVAITRAGRTWRYEYDHNGNLIAEVAPHLPGQGLEERYTTSFTYDALDRLIEERPAVRELSPDQQSRYADGPTIYEYDLAGIRNAVGRLARVTLPFATIEYEYSAEGWVTVDTREFSVDPFGTGVISDTRVMRMDYNALGQPVSVIHADDMADPTATLTDYDERGLPVTVRTEIIDAATGIMTSTVWASVERNLAGVPTLRASLEQQHTWLYDDLGRVTDHVVNGATGTVAGEILDYDAVGNVRSVTDVATSLAISYTYDTQHQLLTATSDDNTTYVASFTYSPAGRILHTEVESSVPAPDVWLRNVDYDYAPDLNDTIPSDPAAVRRLTSLDSGDDIATYDYDASGSVVHKTAGETTWDFIYDGYDKLRETVAMADGNGISTTQEVYYYDHTGQRMLAIRAAFGDEPSRVRWWFGSTEIWYDLDGHLQKSQVEVSLGGQPVARVENGDTGEPEYIYQGVLRNLLAVLGSRGETLARFTYGPYGELLAVDGAEAENYHRRFNGEEFDDLTQLSYYGFRYYDRLSLNWTQADPLYRYVPDLAYDEPRRMGSYTFVLNNPLRYVDPDGRDPSPDGGIPDAGSTPDSDAPLCSEGAGADFASNCLTSEQFDQLCASGHPRCEFPDLSDAIHSALDIVGTIDPSGVCDALNAAVYCLEGDFENAAISGLSILPGGDIAKSVRLGKKSKKLSKIVEGEFSIIDWSGYPGPDSLRPQGPFRLLKGKELADARKAANQANKEIRKPPTSHKITGRYDLKGSDLEVHEIKPLKFGGSPTDPANKVILPKDLHKAYTKWWNDFLRDLEK